MRLTVMGRDLIKVDETNYKTPSENKIHLIKMAFLAPTEEKINTVLENYPLTNRFIVEDNIKTYNSVLKTTNKKYYVQNPMSVGLISFFRRNNKVLLDFTRLNDFERQFILMVCLDDVLLNTEVVFINKDDYDFKISSFTKWPGNVILSENQKL